MDIQGLLQGILKGGAASGGSLQALLEKLSNFKDEHDPQLNPDLVPEHHSLPMGTSLQTRLAKARQDAARYNEGEVANSQERLLDQMSATGEFDPSSRRDPGIPQTNQDAQNWLSAILSQKQGLGLLHKFDELGPQMTPEQRKKAAQMTNTYVRQANFDQEKILRNLMKQLKLEVKHLRGKREI